MKRILAVIVMLCWTGLFSQPMENLAVYKEVLRSYYTSGQFEKEVRQIVDSSLIVLRTFQLPDKACAVFDVDETALDNYKEIESMDFGYRADLWDAWIYSAKAPAIKPMKELFDTLKNRGVGIVFLTGRNTRHAQATAENLQRAGFSGYDTLIVKPEVGTKMHTGEYKSQVRKALQEQGYTIILCAGDQESDLAGFSGPIRVKLPNKIYSVE